LPHCNIGTKKPSSNPANGPSAAFLAHHAACVALVNTSPILHGDPMALELTPLISEYGVWLVAGFIALESVGIPLPAEAALMAAAFFAAKTNQLNIWTLIAAGIGAAIVGEIVGFWIGRAFGHQLLTTYGGRLGLTQGRMRVGQWLFAQYGGTFVFTARFLPFLRNIAAVLAGSNHMGPYAFYFASATAAIIWVMGYGLAAYAFGEAFMNLASPLAVSLGLTMGLLILGVPTLILRYEKRLLAKAERTSRH
jgi:membrane protein DedA with SNARE-associated domain